MSSSVACQNVMAVRGNLKNCVTQLQIKNMPPERLKELPREFDKIILFLRSEESVDLETIVEMIETLRSVTSYLLEKVDELDELKEVVKNLEKELERLKCDELTLLSGQIALKFEKVLIDHILKGTEVNKRYMTLDLLDDAIYGDRKRRSKGIFSSEDERKRAQDNWNKLERHLQLEDDDEYCRAIKALKDIRNTTAHPFKTVTDAQRILKNQDGVDEYVLTFLGKLRLMRIEDIQT